MDRNDNLFDKNTAPVPDEENGDVIPEGIKTEDDVLIDEIFAETTVKRPRQGGSPRAARMKAVPTFTKADVDEAAATINRLMETGKFDRALDLVFTLKGALRAAVRDTVTVTIPMGSRDSELRQIAAGALIQSYLEQGKIVRRDIEDKLFAIIESSEPEYDEDDEIIEQSPEEILYKVMACVIFACSLCEGSGNHPNEKSAMYQAGDSVLDSFLAENLDSVMRKNKKRVLILTEAFKMQGGTVGMKFASYVAESSKNTESVFLKFLGDKISFRVTAGVLLGLCLIAIVIYLFNRSALLSFVATDSVVMLFIIGAEVFFLVGMVTLALLIGFGNDDKKNEKPQSKRPNEGVRPNAPSRPNGR